MKYSEMITRPLSYDDIIGKIQASEKFDISRYGDGELECMFHKRGRPMNSDLHKYYPDLGEALIDVWKNWSNEPSYYLGLQNLAFRQNTEVIMEYTEKYGIEWCGADVFHKASMRGRINELVDALKERDVIVIGNHHLKKLGFEHYEIPMKNAWKAYDRIVKYVEDNISEEKVIVYCCGMMASVLVDYFAGEATQIDAGSCFDPYCGYMSRGYHFELPVPKGESSAYFKQRGK